MTISTTVCMTQMKEWILRQQTQSEIKTKEKTKKWLVRKSVAYLLS